MPRLTGVRRRVGHRGASLLALAFVDLIYGTLLICERPIPGTTLEHLGRNWPPLDAWGVAWILVGLLCLVQAFMRQDTPAFIGAVFIKFLWAAAHFWAATEGAPRAWAGFAIWGVFLWLVVVIATWREPDLPGGEVP